MTSCPRQPLTASADINDCSSASPRPSPRLPPQWPHCCGTTGTRCSLFCGGCTAGDVSHRILYSTATAFFIARGIPLAAVAACAYGALDIAQAANSACGQVAQAVLATAALTAAAGDSACVFFVWLGFIAAIMHVAAAVTFMEMERMGDCRKCCNTYGLCKCGKRKDPLPAGTLERLARLVQRRWLRRKTAQGLPPPPPR